MSGLIKPLTQRGRNGATSRRTRNPAINSNHYGGRGGVLCGKKSDSLFVSSYHEDKKKKYQEQMKERVKKWLVVGVLAFVVFLVKGPRSSESKSNEASSLLRSSDTQKIETSANDAAPPPPPKVEPILKTTHNPVKFSPAATTAKTSIKKGDTKSLCGRKIPIDLADHTTWATPMTPTLGADIDANNKEVTLQKTDGIYGNLGGALGSLFHAFDYAAEHKRKLYITQDSWVFKTTLFPLFFGPTSAVEQNDSLWAAVQETLSVKVIENEGVLALSGLKDPEYQNTMMLFYKSPRDYDPTKIRNHRNTVLRKLFLYPSTNACASVDSVVGDNKSKKYTVIHVADSTARNYLGKLEGVTHRSHDAASEMRPDYVKNILKQVDMLQHPIYPLDATGNDVDSKVHDALAKDSELAGSLKEIPFDTGGNVYLAVLADVYLGNPGDQLSLWITRMRYALGIKNTFIFTEQKAGNWVSYLDDEKYLELYDTKFLATPWMG